MINKVNCHFLFTKFFSFSDSQAKFNVNAADASISKCPEPKLKNTESSNAESMVVQQKVPTRTTKRKSTQTTNEHTPSKRSKTSAFESKVKIETCDEPSTSQADQITEAAGECTTADNNWIDKILSDSIQNESHDAENDCMYVDVREFLDNSDVIINPSEMPTNTTESSQLIQPKLERMEDDAYPSYYSIQVENQTPNKATNHYYQRKVFKQEKEPEFQVEKLVDEWEDIDGEQQNVQTENIGPDLVGVDVGESYEVDVISVASETSDSEFGFFGDPYYESDPTEPKRNATS